MKAIFDQSTDPYFNLAAEEYVLKNFDDDVFMLWRNGPSIIVGKHQNTLSEINIDYVKENDIKVVRRLSGGGAVFHDLGNINFTFIMNGKDEQLIDFRKYTKPILEVMQNLGIDARFEGRNDLTIGGRKFSGNAEHVFKKRILHHGTLLFASEMADLSHALNVNPLKFKDKAVKSNRSRVTNISEHLNEPMEVLEFANRIMNHIKEKYDDVTEYSYSEEDIAAITKLREEKYSQWEWNFGYSPKYNFSKFIKTEGGSIEFNLDVEKGIIEEIKIFGDFFNKLDIDDIENAIRGASHDEFEIRKRLKNFNINDYFNNITLDDLIRGLF